MPPDAVSAAFLKSHRDAAIFELEPDAASACHNTLCIRALANAAICWVNTRSRTASPGYSTRHMKERFGLYDVTHLPDFNVRHFARLAAGSPKIVAVEPASV